MSFYYDVCRQASSNGTGSTESQHLRFQTASQQESASLRSVYGSSVFGTAGGGKLRVKSAATIGSGGTSQTPGKKNANSPAASLTVFNDATSLTPGTTLTQRLAIGVAQTGGNGGWVAQEPAAGLQLLANGGANGNAELYSIFNAATVALDVLVEFAEGQ